MLGYGFSDIISPVFRHRYGNLYYWRHFHIDVVSGGKTCPFPFHKSGGGKLIQRVLNCCPAFVQYFRYLCNRVDNSVPALISSRFPLFQRK